MTTRNISLTAEHDAFIEEVVRVGEYRSASEVVRVALGELQAQRRVDAATVKVLRGLVRQGIDDLDAGRYREVTDGELDGYFDELRGWPRPRAHVET